MNSSNRNVNFSNQRSSIPFGKFEAGTNDVFPCNESMVGRDGARAKLIDFLTNAGTRKAILVTGRRGMGKTSFVNYCLNEYVEERIERYWKSDLGRTISSWIWLLAICILCSTVYIISSWILKVFIDNAANEQNYFFWIPIAILLFFLCWPLIHSIKIFSVIFKNISEIFSGISRDNRIYDKFSKLYIQKIISPKLIAYFCILATIFIILHIPDGGSATLTLSRLLVIFATVYSVGEYLDIYILSNNNILSSWLALLIFGITGGLCAFNFDPIVKLSTYESIKYNNLISNISVAFILSSFALFSRYVSLLKKPTSIKYIKDNIVLKKSQYWFLTIGFVFLTTPVLIVFITNHQHIANWFFMDEFKLEYNIKSKWFYILPVFSILIFREYFRSSHDENIQDHNYKIRHVSASVLLFFKGVFYILLSLYALHPILTLLDSSKENYCYWRTDSDIRRYINWDQGIFTSKTNRSFCNIYETKYETSTKDESIISSKKYIPLLVDTKDELTYLAIIVTIIAIIFWIEYEWIIRPAHYRRRDSSMGGKNRPSYFDDLYYGEYTFDFIHKTSKNKSSCIPNKIFDCHEILKYMKREANIRERRRDFENLTFLGYFKHLHFTTLVSTINLGFEELNHCRVIHAMLLDIREQYYEKFVSLHSMQVIVRFIFGSILLMFFVTAITNTQFNLNNLNASISEAKKPNDNKKTNKNLNVTTKKINLISDTDKQKSVTSKVIINELHSKPRNQNNTEMNTSRTTHNKYCHYNKDGIDNINYDHLPNVPKLLCELGGIYSELIIPIIYFEIIPIILYNTDNHNSNLLNWLVDIRIPYYLNGNNKPNRESLIISFCIYHLLISVFLLFLFRIINRKFGLSPYSLNLQKIDDLLHTLTSTKTIKRNRDIPMYTSFASGLSGSFHENEHKIEISKLDSRIVELQFMSVLEKISHSHPFYYKPLLSDEYSSTIEITFIFDELDKLATDIYSQEQRGGIDSNDSELHRLNLMKELLSNMKRIITTSEARYIFLGGRLLHDDWLADGARRQPLLTSIFSDEIYLPSLLTDTSIVSFTSLSEVYSLNTRVEEFFVWQYYLSQMRFDQWATRIWNPIFAMPEWDVRSRGFIQVSYEHLINSMKNHPDLGADISLNMPTPLHTVEIRSNYDGKNLNRDNSNFEYSTLCAFLQFLSYRSAGNPKRLNELLASFIMTADRAIDTQKGREVGFNCQDVLYLPDHKVMRIQLVARVYRHLCKGFEEKIRGRDDKTIISLIYLSDFLFKFHGRAFSWESLELIDELIHMHRGHDLRILLHELVEHYTDRYLHRIINGMYTYRFRTYFANEIEYLSRHSQEEMAAFNFTLDEAQTLRSHLEGQLDSGDNREKSGILSMLGELHEFYQEYEVARQYYRKCIAARFPMINDHLGEKVGEGNYEISVIQAIYTNKVEGREALLALQHWGPMTLRWFLQIVMTYELEHNYNDALIRYERYITFAECMIQSFTAGEPEKIDILLLRHTYNKKLSTEHAYVLEYLGLLFEPLFAYAWLLEKNSYTSGKSYFVLNSGIEKYEKILEKDVSPKYLGFIKAQWYKKIGALCFYKGLFATKDKSYVTRAREYYSKSAIQLSLYFRRGVETKFNENDGIIKTISSLSDAFLVNQYPTDYLFGVAESLGDLSESILGEINPIELFTLSEQDTQQSFFEKVDEDFEKTTFTLVRQLDQYFFNSNNKDKLCVLNHLASLNYPNISNSSPEEHFISLNLLQKYDLSLNLSLASSFYMLRAGYIESAAREAMHTAEVIAQYLNWYWFYIITHGEIKSHKQHPFNTSFVMKKVIWYVKYIHKLFSLIRTSHNVKSKTGADDIVLNSYLVGEIIPSSALTSLCSIGMSLSHFIQAGNTTNSTLISHMQKCTYELSVLIEKWTGNEMPSLHEVTGYSTDKYSYFENKLIYSLQRHRYPVLNQLNALKILVDNSLFSGYLLIDKSAIQNTCAWLQELHHINQKYNHPMHFTPMQSGLSMYLYWYLIDSKIMDKHMEEKLNLSETTDFDIHSEFRRLLIQSLDMCNMGRGYYEAISNMYYLYDDFNDNQIHRNHAMQMAGSQLTKYALNH